MFRLVDVWVRMLGSDRREKGVMRGKKELHGSLNPNKMTYVMFQLISLTAQNSKKKARMWA
jgi:hypothetical protein